MKPITLTIKGLHSFREEQTIDFSSLCDAGVFGIFGPTGSGKSSILDAMTLALYGKVERALNNTHGILNQAEEKLSVSFTFALQKEHHISYKVERAFKRADEMKVRTTLCRLIEIGDTQTVLADKASEVNRKVEELLGLTIDDFTRAVVLPQGKFAEFLSLKGADRRQMLQRLFNLEKYGDQLVKRLRAKAQKHYGQKNELLAELNGLGEAGPEALAKANEAAEQAKAIFHEKKQARDEALTAFTKAQTIWQYQKEQEAYETEQNKLNLLAPSIEEKRAKLHIAEQAETLKPYADALTKAEKQLSQASKEKQEAEKQLLHQRTIYDQMAREYEQDRQKKIETEPDLLQKKEQLIQLKEIERKKEAALQEKTGIERQKNEKAQQLLQKKKEAENLQSLLERALTKQTQLKNELEQLQVSVKERKSVQDALRLSENVERINLSIQKEKQKLEEFNKRASQTSEAYERLQKQQNDHHEKIDQSFQAIEHLYFYVCELERALTEWSQKEQQQKLEKLKQRDAVRAAELRKELAAELVDGEPCPVCGSIHHDPKALQSNDHEETVAQVDEVIQRMDKELKQAEDYGRDMYAAKQLLETHANQLVKQFAFLSQKAPGAEVAAAVEMVQNSQSLQDLMQEWKGIKQDIQEVEQKRARLMDETHDQSAEMSKMKEQMTFEQQRIEELEVLIKELHAELSEQTTQFEQTFPHLTLNQVQEMQKQIDEKDQQAEGYKERIEKSISFLEEKQLAKEQLQTVIYNVEKELDKLAHQLESQQQLIQQYEIDLGRYPLKAASISDELIEVEHSLSLLNEKEQQSYKQLQHAQQLFSEAQSHFSSSERQLQEANKRKQETAAAWETAAESSPFHMPQEIESVSMEQAVRQSVKQEIEEFEDKRKECAANLKRISELLKEESLDEKQWMDIQHRKEAAEKALEEATAMSGSAHEHLRVMEENHQRFASIHERLEALQQEIDRLDKLQTVFKGNTFVEFLAEEQLESVSRDASARLGMLTRQRYAIEVDSEGGFVMRDDANGGVRRPVSSLSGGETFLTSLALALALSAQIQLRGEFPLQFFFLDEGFGTLDQDLLDTVITALEKLQSHNLAVGVISHVEELKMRLPKKLIVHPADPSGKGTTVSMELM
ncbi:AAA family ATPase [Bacillus pumilus]|uniref:AAA family ATPase n=1 Tax=Bacillus TaxID=1386 RepID=UPI00071769EE|nr:SMC family ATPase [Bacillus pumilus]AMM96779.1 DNA repair exonuclease [Bacillus pumilus]KRU17197.1 DNA repair exonuclease [Bacillus pumilus]MCY7679194.1 SMC family ATPase [Bacillus pumilus]MDH3150829.1 SMC family ATPase [Bacillus pumilus]